MTVPALLGATALWLTYAWLLSAILASYISNRKGYGERPGLAAGLLLTVAGVLLWLAWPAKADSRWKRQGPLPRRVRVRTVAQRRPEREVAAGGDTAGEVPLASDKHRHHRRKV